MLQDIEYKLLEAQNTSGFCCTTKKKIKIELV